jgi:hypothetical protein
MITPPSSLVALYVSVMIGIIPPADSLSFIPGIPNFFNNAPTPAPAPAAAMSNVATTSNKSAFRFRYTHLEGNGQLWQIDAPSDNGSPTNDEEDATAALVSVVVDPLASQLDFGIPWGYRANKNVLSEDDTIDIICRARPSHCLLTMGLDDHTHLPTLRKLMERMPDLRYVVAPSCRAKLTEGLGIGIDRITVLDHGQSCDTSDDDGGGGGGCGAMVTATRGALVGPPWQKRENGYLLEFPRPGVGTGGRGRGSLSVYYEPHGDVILDDIKAVRADVVVSPVTKQSLPAQVPPGGQFTLVYGGERTLQVAEALGARVIVPLGNGALDIEGPLAGLVCASGNVDDFEELVARRNDAGGVRATDDCMIVERSTPGVPLTILI